MSKCYCEALGDFVALSDDPREETRLRRTFFGIEIQRWLLASTIFIPDAPPDGSPACEADGATVADPRAARTGAPNHGVATNSTATGCHAHEHA